MLFRYASEKLAGRGTVLPLTLEEADFGDQKFDAITLGGTFSNMWKSRWT